MLCHAVTVLISDGGDSAAQVEPFVVEVKIPPSFALPTYKWSPDVLEAAPSHTDDSALLLLQEYPKSFEIQISDPAAIICCPEPLDASEFQSAIGASEKLQFFP